MFLSKSWIVGVLVIAAVLVTPALQALANHTADVWVRILYVRVLDDDDGFLGGCAEVYAAFNITSTTGEVRAGSTKTIENVCAVSRIFRNRLFQLTPPAQRITAGNIQFNWRVMEEDPGVDDTMNSGSAANVPCDGAAHDFLDLAGVGEAADIKIRVRCTPLAHVRGAAELGNVHHMIDGAQTSHLQVFDASGQKILDLETEQAGQSLTDKARNQLANGLYLVVVTRRNSNGHVYSQRVQRLLISR